MKDLTTKIRNAAEFDEKAPYKHGWVIDSNGEQEQCEWTYIRCKEAMKHQHAQTQWAFEALEKAVAHIEQTEWLEYHACITGDCPHTTQYECFVAITDEFKNQSKCSIEVRAEIAALVPKGENE